MFYKLFLLVSLTRLTEAQMPSVNLTATGFTIGQLAILRCSWDGTANTVIIYKDEHRITTVKSGGKSHTTTPYLEVFGKKRIKIEQTNKDIAIHIARLQCSDSGKYSCNVDGRESGVTLKEPKVSTPSLSVFPGYYNKGVSILEKIEYHCYATTGKTRQGRLVWWTQLQNQEILGPVSARSVTEMRVNTECMEMIKSTITIRASTEYVNFKVFCRLENRAENIVAEKQAPCDQKNYCVASSPLKVKGKNTGFSVMSKANLLQTDFKPPKEMKLRCSADDAGLPSKYPFVESVTLQKVTYPGFKNTSYWIKYDPDDLIVEARKHAAIPKGRQMSVKYIEQKFNDKSYRKRGIELTVKTTKIEDRGMYLCIIEHVDGPTFGFYGSWQYISHSFKPKKPGLSGRTKVLTTNLLEVNARCKARLSSNGQLTWILRSSANEHLALWPFFFLGGPNETINHFGRAAIISRSDGSKFPEMIISLHLLLNSSMKLVNIGCSSQSLLSKNEYIQPTLFTSRALSQIKQVLQTYPEEDYPAMDLVIGAFTILLVLSVFGWILYVGREKKKQGTKTARQSADDTVSKYTGKDSTLMTSKISG